MSEIEYTFVRGAGWIPGEKIPDSKHPRGFHELPTDYFYIVNEKLLGDVTTWYGLDSQEGFSEPDNALAQGIYRFEVWLPDGRNVPQWTEDSEGERYNEVDAMAEVWRWHSYFKMEPTWRCRLVRIS